MAALEEESGILLMPEFVGQFSEAVIHAKWEEAFDLLPQLELADVAHSKFLIHQQTYFELIFNELYAEALTVLQNLVLECSLDLEQIESLTQHLLSYTDAPIENVLESRKDLLDQIHLMIPSHILLRPKRYEELYDRALVGNSPGLDLFEDSKEHTEFKITKFIHSWQAHKSEAWFGSFSPNNELFASFGNDFLCFIWDMKSLKRKCILESHKKNISSVSWSLDSQSIVTTCFDCRIRIWSQSGRILGRIVESSPSTSSIWIDNVRFICANPHENMLKVWSLQGDLLCTFPVVCPGQVSFSQKYQYIYASSLYESEGIINSDLHVFNLDTFEEEERVTFKNIVIGGIEITAFNNTENILCYYSQYKNDCEETVVPESKLMDSETGHYILIESTRKPCITKESVLLLPKNIFAKTTTDLSAHLHTSPVNSVYYNQLYEYIVTMADDGFIKIWK